MSKSNAAHVIVIGNEKGGAGKTTTAMHLTVALLRMGFKVGTIDLDGRQKTFSRYMENRETWIAENGVRLKMPDHRTIQRSIKDSSIEATAEDEETLRHTVKDLSSRNAFVVIDCPGSDVALARYAHALADTLITPINDSLVDLDVIVQMETNALVDLDAISDTSFREPGVYTSMVITQRKLRMEKMRSGMDWIVLRNRLSSLADKNKAALSDMLTRLSKVMGFRLTSGFGERVIFRQLFLSGLTVLDLRETGVEYKLTMSHIAARQEVRGLLAALWLPKVEERLDRI